MGEIVNKVAQSGIQTIDLGTYYPEGKRHFIDLKDQLWQGLALKEQEFRTFVKEHDWTRYQDGHVGVFCSADAIIPTWAYMLIASFLSGIATTIHFGDSESLEARLWTESLKEINPAEYEDARVVIKGCSDRYVSPSAFLELSAKLKPLVRSLMFGEPCSTVPIFKRPIQK